MTDLYTLFIDVILRLQRDELIKTKNIVTAFIAKLLVYKRNIDKHEFNNFPMYQKYPSEMIICYLFIVNALITILTGIAYWALHPFSNIKMSTSSQLVKQLIELQQTRNEIKN